jgi:predicted CoA-binding protein
MNDQMEDFIRNNREAFDDKEPSGKVWSTIEGSLKLNARAPWYNSLTLWRAAAVVFMVMSAYLLIIPEKEALRQNELASGQNEKALKEFADVELFYVKQISEKVEMIDGFERNEGLNGFTRDFQQLEAMYLVLREEIKTRPSQKVKDALVLNLLVQIDLLNQQIHKLEKEYKPQSEEKPKANI